MANTIATKHTLISHCSLSFAFTRQSWACRCLLVGRQILKLSHKDILVKLSPCREELYDGFKFVFLCVLQRLPWQLGTGVQSLRFKFHFVWHLICMYSTFWFLIFHVPRVAEVGKSTPVLVKSSKNMTMIFVKSAPSPKAKWLSWKTLRKQIGFRKDDDFFESSSKAFEDKCWGSLLSEKPQPFGKRHSRVPPTSATLHVPNV